MKHKRNFRTLEMGMCLDFQKATEGKFQKITISELDCLVKFQNDLPQ